MIELLSPVAVTPPTQHHTRTSGVHACIWKSRPLHNILLRTGVNCPGCVLISARAASDTCMVLRLLARSISSSSCTSSPNKLWWQRRWLWCVQAAVQHAENSYVSRQLQAC